MMIIRTIMIENMIMVMIMMIILTMTITIVTTTVITIEMNIIIINVNYDNKTESETLFPLTSVSGAAVQIQFSCALHHMCRVRISLSP